ncbi:cobalamin biosynthesis protein CbiD [Desulfobacter hydrogenophilus]|uniref:Cobalt-precorrin-5B C(1)-methyltransferase n=1 Tax=Desulfobacter hydrogenophilus TaxID=2291 RepID=A0A328FDR0_9BACT|nr:cobalt-precorrin-5B (C(1))-methyltransferase CbiD [Desulfobacter hydrogenophilus]NDY71255.1 cobalt-precorrin-5B (C(1))-methyltransferase [Desulfobacter hydrogenophilus]QBH15007.1 cobalt-precorrin-5B (C(1))-methyltransferase [Desulfobacter hydrogenophilus]RAM02791.1 cobalamin biosynthesis protein CbiD [Desulfobacter hydrogenophilus]
MSDREKKNLRQGFTTGTAAAAAVKAALVYLFTKQIPGSVNINLLNGQRLEIPVDSVSPYNGFVRAVVVKDAGDDPDITHRARIGAVVGLTDDPGTVQITGGKGVGMVTKPGLEVLPGEPAINPGPRKMIRESALQMLTRYYNHAGVSAEIFVENGEVLAERTLNRRLGIEGGLSILGTTGLVKPLSHEAYTATIRSAMSVARACGCDHVVLTTGRRSERFSQIFFTDLYNLHPEAFIQIGDFFGMSMESLAENKIPNATLAVFFGKALKIAQGFVHTHAAKADLTMDWLADVVSDETGNKTLAREVASANTARHAFGMLWPGYPDVLEKVGAAMIRSAEKFCPAPCRFRVVIYDFEGTIAFDSHRMKKSR